MIIAIHYELEHNEGKHLPNPQADAEFMEKVKKDGNSVYKRAVTEGPPEYARLCVQPSDHAEFGAYHGEGTGSQRFPRYLIRSVGHPRIINLSRELIKHLGRRVGKPVNQGDGRGRRRLQCDDAGWVRFSTLAGCPRIMEHLSDDRPRTTEAAAAIRVDMLREEVRLDCWKVEFEDQELVRNSG